MNKLWLFEIKNKLFEIFQTGHRERLIYTIKYKNLYDSAI